MAATDANVFVLLACLDPWLSALHQLHPPNGDIPLRHTDANGFRIVSFGGYQLFGAAPPQESLDRVCEALSLLDVIARANGELWKKIVLEIWAEDEGLRKWLEEEQLPKTFVVGMGLSDMRLEITRRVFKQLSGVGQDAAVGPSSEYLEVLGFLKNELALQCYDKDTSSIVRVCIELDGSCGRIGENDSEMLQGVLNYVRTKSRMENKCAELNRESTIEPPQLAVTNVDLTTGTRVDMGGLRILHELARFGVAVSHLPVLAMQPSDEELPEFVQALRDLVGLDDDRIAGVSTICIDDRYSPWPVIRAVLTAAQHSSKARTIELDVGENQGDPRFREFLARNNEDDDEEDDDDSSEDVDEEIDNASAAVDEENGVNEDEQAENAQEDDDNDDGGEEEDDEEEEEQEDEEDYLDVLNRLNGRDSDHSRLWQWIAFTLFSRHADHNIETLELNSETLQESEVEAIRRVLNAPNPYAVARGRPGVLPRQFVPRQITAARFILQYPTPDAGPPFMAKSPIAVRVLETPDKGVFPWYQILLPGYGDAYVHEDDVVSKSEDNLRLNNRQVTPLPEFSRIEIVNLSDDSMDPVADLIGLIGHETRRISYMEHLGDRGFEDWCTRVLKSCPKLEELHMDGGFVDDLNTFEASARAGLCRLRELSVSCAPTGDKAQNVQRLFDALSDPVHPLTEHLRKLRVGLIVETEDSKDVVDPVLRMLRENQRLVEITLVLKFTEAVEAHRPEFESALDNRPRDTIVIRVAPLKLRCKLAFVSAVDHEARVLDRALGQLDSSVLAIVLQFAAEGRARTCTVFYEEFPRRLF